MEQFRPWHRISGSAVADDDPQNDGGAFWDDATDASSPTDSGPGLAPWQMPGGASLADDAWRAATLPAAPAVACGKFPSSPSPGPAGSEVPATDGSASGAVPDSGALSAGVSLQSLLSVPIVAGGLTQPVADGVVGTGGSTALLADQLRNTFGIDGTGIKIGVLSDSFNLLGGAAADYADGALPSSGVTVLQEGTSGNDEGRAILELVHQIAPGAQLYFATTDGGDNNFAGNIAALRTAGCNIIVDDALYFDEPMFQEGIVSKEIDRATALGDLYFTAAGNDASNAYQAQWSAVTPQQATIGAGADIVFDLQGDQSFNSPTTSLGLSFTDNLGETFTATEEGGVNYDGEAVTLLEVANPHDFAISGTLTISDLAGPAPSLVKLAALGNGQSVSLAGANTGTVIGHAEDPNAITVGAANAQTGSLEDYTSSGAGTEWLRDTSGNPLSSPELLNKVDLTSVDNIATDVFNPFKGTSAAAPTAAAVAALLEQAVPDASAATIENALKSTAANLGDPAALQGAGLINALAAGDSIATPHVYTDSTGRDIFVGTGSNTVTSTSRTFPTTIFVSKSSSNTVEGGPNPADRLDYSLAPGPVTVNLPAHTVTHSFGGTDTFSNIETILGSAFNDTFVLGGSGLSDVSGGAGTNTIDESSISASISVFLGLGSGSVTVAGGGTTSFDSIEIVNGGTGNENATWNGGSYTLNGGSGANVLEFETGPGDSINLATGVAVGTSRQTLHFSNFQTFHDNFADATIIGGAGNHTITSYIAELDYADAPGAVTVNLATDSTSNGFGGTDTFLDAGTFVGSAFNDTFIAGPGSHTINGGGGSDTLVLHGPRANYQMTQNGQSGAIITDLVGNDGTETLQNVATAQFSDQSVSLVPSPPTTSLLVPQEQTIGPDHQVLLSSLFSASDASFNSITQYNVFEGSFGTPVGTLTDANGHVMPTFRNDTVTSLAGITYHSSTNAGSDRLWVQAFADGQWGNWAFVQMANTGATPPVASATVAEDPVGPNQTVALTSLFSASVPDGDPITQYNVYEGSFGTPVGTVTDENGNVIPTFQNDTVTSLAGINYHSSTIAGADRLWVQAYADGEWGNWALVQMNNTGDPPPVVSAVNDQTVRPNQTVALTSLFSASEASGDPITQYNVFEGSFGAPVGTLTDNGSVLPTFQNNTVTSLAGITYHSSLDAGTDRLWVQAYADGQWGPWTMMQMANTGGTPPVTSATVAEDPVGPNQTVALTSLFSATVADGDPISQYNVYEGSFGTPVGTVTDENGTVIPTFQNDAVTSLAGINYHSSTSAGTDRLWVQAFADGQWGKWALVQMDNVGSGGNASLAQLGASAAGDTSQVQVSQFVKAIASFSSTTAASTSAVAPPPDPSALGALGVSAHH
jgi:hypothetical protein